jgi:hypothetical protein
MPSPTSKPTPNKRGFYVIDAEVNTQLLENQQQALRACMTVDSEMGKRLRELIFQQLKAARNSISESIKFDNGDPRGTRHAVKRYIASKYLGGVVSIASYNAKASGNRSSYEAPRKLVPGQRGGNRMKRGGRTAKILSYGPQDRMFILNWINAGTQGRYSGHGRNGRNEADYEKFILKYEGRGWRGSIAPRNFFGMLGGPAMQKAVENLGRMIDEEFDKLFK